MMKGTVDLSQPHNEQWDHNYTPNNLSFPNPNSKPTTDLSEWVENLTKQLIEDLPENIIDVHSNYDAASDIVPALLDELRPRKIAKRELSQLDDQGLGLITLLLECAVAISVDNLGEAHRMLLELTQMASPYAPSCAERVVAYFSKAMISRVINSWLGICSPLINHKSIHSAIQVFNNVSPFIKFAHFTSNQAILEAFHRQDSVHIIDLDIMQGLQWPALFHILANRIEGPPHVRLTGLGSTIEILAETGKQLSNFATRLGLSFEFHPIAKKLGDLDNASELQICRGETLSVHWLQHSLYDASGPDQHSSSNLACLEYRHNSS